jgi:glycine cleavage system protein P-like pyridoxal-binding family
MEYTDEELRRELEYYIDELKIIIGSYREVTDTKLEDNSLYIEWSQI